MGIWPTFILTLQNNDLHHGLQQHPTHERSRTAGGQLNARFGHVSSAENIASSLPDYVNGTTDFDESLAHFSLVFGLEWERLSEVGWESLPLLQVKSRIRSWWGIVGKRGMKAFHDGLEIHWEANGVKESKRLSAIKFRCDCTHIIIKL